MYHIWRESGRMRKNPTPENCEINLKWRNETTKERRKAIRQYWKKVSDNIKFDPRKFYRTFRPFTDFENKHGSSGNICLQVNDVLANHFAIFFLHNG